MTTAVIIVLLIRLLVPLTIFKYRISGAVASIVVDALDVVVVEALQSLFGGLVLGITIKHLINGWICIIWL